MQSHKITIIGSGYVGLSLAVLLAQYHAVRIVDIDEDKVKNVNSRISPIKDSLISEYFEKKELDLMATNAFTGSIEDADIIIIATPTNYDDKTNCFDTSSVNKSIEKILTNNRDALIIIKSTLPEGHTSYLSQKYKTNKIIFSPEFSREGLALYDNLYPSRIIIGSNCEEAKMFARILEHASLKSHVDVLFTSPSEAEAIKLFSNTYLALRVAFFNELDTYAFSKKLNSKNIIRGLGLDQRIGSHYNNPSFGYGGYCLPKDTKQLLANFNDIPQDLISAVIKSNETRKTFIADKIKEKNCNTIGFYKLSMKKGSDNFRSSSILGVIDRFNSSSKKLIIFESDFDNSLFDNIEIETDLLIFKQKSDLIVTNRFEKELIDVKDKVFTRDLFEEN